MDYYELEIDYHEIENEFELNGDKYTAICGITIFFDIDKDKDYTGFFYKPINVKFELNSLILSNEKEEILEENIPEEIIKKVMNHINPRKWECRMIEHYMEVK